MAGALPPARQDGDTGPRPVDLVRAGMPLFRLAVAVSMVAASPLVPGVTRGDEIRFALLVAFAWLPVAGAVAIVARRRPGWATDLLQLVVDLGLLVLLATQLQPPPGALVASSLLLAAAFTYLGGRADGAIAAVVGFVLIAATGPAGSAVNYTLAIYPVAAVALVGVAHAAAAERWRASASAIRSHEKSDAILTGVAESVVVTSRAGRIVQWNRAAAETFGYSAAEVKGRACSAVLSLRHDVRELDCSSGCPLLALGAAERGDVEVWRMLPTGQRQPLLATAVPVVVGSGKPVEVVHSYRDITRLKQADEAKTMFLATASHELKTPLTVIRGFSQMLLLPDAGFDDAQRESALRAIDLRAAQLTGIVDRLLMSSRIEAGRIDLAPALVDVTTALAERAQAVRSTSARDLVLEIEPGSGRLWVDLDAFTTIVDHLFDNAVKYSPNGGPVTVGLHADASSPERALLTVADEGVGMTRDQLQHCFDRFWQAEPTDVRRFGGTGIGLYIVRSLAEAMGGSVHAASRPGAGATFTVTFRAAAPTARADVDDEVDDDVDRDQRDDAELAPTAREPSIIREYMRQLGVRVERV